jgi:SulP family sulfate permease
MREGFRAQDVLPALPAALLTWFLTVIFSVSIAALIFRGPLEPWLSTGIGMSLFSAVVLGLVTTLRSSLPGVIAIPSDRTAPMLAILAGGLALQLRTHGDPSRIIATSFTALLIATFLSGVTLALLGHYRLGQLIRFLPFPVVGGFMAGAGWLLVKGALTVLTGLEMTPSHALELLNRDEVLRWAPAVVMALVLVVATRRLRHFAVIPVVVAASVALFYLIAFMRGVPLIYLRSIGWLPGPFLRPIGWSPQTMSLLAGADWASILGQVFTISTVLLIAATSMLMICSALELAANVEVDVDRELETAGVANLVAALGGGLVGFHSLSVSTLVLRSGPRSRWVGVFAALGTLATLVIFPGIVAYLPVPVLGGLLLFLGLNFLTEWLVTAFRRMPGSEYSIVVLIVVAVAGVVVGLALAVVLFTLHYSRIDVVRLQLNGSQQRSNVDRTAAEREILREVGPSILILKLQGFIFFGTAHSILHRVRLRALQASQAPLRQVILDFRSVTGIDSSTLLSFSKLLQIGAQLGFRVICTNLPPRVLRSLRRDALLFRADGLLVQPDIDHAMEECEAAVLAAHREAHGGTEAPPEELRQGTLRDFPALAHKLAVYLVREEVAPGMTLAVQGERTRDLFLIEKGQVSAHFKPVHGPAIRLRTMGAGAVVGEIGLYLGRPRSASLVVVAPAVVWRLTPESLARMEAEDPAAASSLHRFLALIVSSRLVHANELIEMALY